MEFVSVIKPTHICNLDCSYCYNDDVRDPIMTEATLHRVVSQVVDYTHKLPRQFDVANFIWHGGEPMVPGIEFYRTALRIQEECSGAGIRCSNHIQTNGTLINSAWIEFFDEHDFGISISIDGPKALHDEYRKDHRGRGSFDRCIRAVEMVQDAGLSVGIVVVLSRANIDYAEEIYDFLSSRQLPFQVVPMTKSGAARDAYDSLGLDADEYGDAWNQMYDKWFYASGKNYVYVMDFALKTEAILKGHPSDCVGLAHCSSSNISVDPVGDVYPCATLSGHEDTVFGNLVEQPLEEIMRSRVSQNYRDRAIDPQCAQCKWQHVCHGGCLARSYKFYGNHHRRDYYCPSLFKMYEHVEQRIGEKGFVASNPGVDHGDEDHWCTVGHFVPERDAIPVLNIMDS